MCRVAVVVGVLSLVMPGHGTGVSNDLPSAKSVLTALHESCLTVVVVVELSNLKDRSPCREV